MNTKILIELLSELAEKDLADGSDILDHPCSLAVLEITVKDKLIRSCVKALKSGNSEKMIQVCEDANNHLTRRF